MPTVTFQVVAQNDFISKFSDPTFWKTYRLYVLREITEKAMEVVRQHASTLWVRPTGALDQSWFSRIDPAKETGFISNSKPYAYWQSVGVRPHRMTYLLNSKNAYFLKDGTKAAVIPITKDDGSKIFRIATEKQMNLPAAVKPWWHPGLEPKNIVETGMEEYREHHLQDDFKGLTIKFLGL